jgi:hypothetical protein
LAPSSGHCVSPQLEPTPNPLTTEAALAATNIGNKTKVHINMKQGSLVFLTSPRLSWPAPQQAYKSLFIFLNIMETGICQPFQQKS